MTCKTGNVIADFVRKLVVMPVQREPLTDQLPSPAASAKDLLCSTREIKCNLNLRTN